MLNQEICLTRYGLISNCAKRAKLDWRVKSLTSSTKTALKTSEILFLLTRTSYVIVCS